MAKKRKLRLLFLDIETAPILAYVWGLFDQNIPLDMIVERTSMLSWSAKWHGSKKIFYHDQSKEKNIRNDKKLLIKLRKMLNEADIVVSHNIAFDKKKSNYRMVANGLKPVKPYKEICTLKIARKHFKFDSNKLKDLAVVLGIDIQKYDHPEFAGNKLFIECLNGNKKAWRDMRKYNPTDVLLLEEVYNALIPWDSTINFNVFYDDNENRCSCGSFVVKKEGGRYNYTKTAKYQQYSCSSCGHWWTDKSVNLLSKIKRKDMLR